MRFRQSKICKGSAKKSTYKKIEKGEYLNNLFDNLSWGLKESCSATKNTCRSEITLYS